LLSQHRHLVDGIPSGYFKSRHLSFMVENALQEPPFELVSRHEVLHDSLESLWINRVDDVIVCARVVFSVESGEFCALVRQHNSLLLREETAEKALQVERVSDDKADVELRCLPVDESLNGVVPFIFSQQAAEAVCDHE